LNFNLKIEYTIKNRDYCLKININVFLFFSI
jgi:hypothetical protein